MAERLLEVCVDTVGGLAAALRGGAGRIELCAALSVGGLTPSVGLMGRAAAEGAVPVHALIRPRAGGFEYDGQEVAVMIADIQAARRAGLAGVVIGAALPDGRLDANALRAMIAAAGPMAVTLNRVFDLVPDMTGAVDLAVSLRIGRILTSGGAVRAVEGLERLAAIHAHAAGRIGILPASGITAENVGELLARLPVAEVHASCAVAVPGGDGGADRGAERLGFAGSGLRETRAASVRALKAAMARVA